MTLMSGDSEDVITGVGPDGQRAALLQRAVLEARARRRPLRVLQGWVPDMSVAGPPGIGPMPLLPEATSAMAQRAAEAALSEALEQVDREHVVTATVLAKQGPAAQVLTEASGRGALLVIGSNHRPRWRNALTFSTTGQVLRRSRSPVMVVPREAPPVAFRRVLLYVHPTANNGAALRWAHEEAARHQCPLEIVCVLDEGTGQAPQGLPEVVQSLERLDSFVQQRGVLDRRHPIRTRLLIGRPAQSLLSEAEDSDLLIVQATDTHGLRRWLRPNLAEHCARHARCVLVVLPEHL